MFSYEKEFVSEIELEQKRVREQKEQEDLRTYPFSLYCNFSSCSTTI